MTQKSTGRKRGRPRKTDAQRQAQVQGEVEAVPEEVPQIQEVPNGLDPGELYASEETKTLEIIFKGQKWVFKYKDLNWGDKNYCIDQAQMWEGQSFKFSVQKYYAIALTRMLVESPIRPITETTLQKLDRNVGERLIAIVPNPIEAPAELEAVKKV